MRIRATILLLPILIPAPATAAAAPVPAGTAPEDEEVRVRLAELASPSALDRDRAQRWLAAHLAPDDSDLVAACARGAEPEVRRRLALAVGAEDRSLALAAALARDPDPDAAAVGRAAAGELAARFSPGLDRPALTGSELDAALLARARRRDARLLKVDLGAPLEETLALLHRSGEAPIGLAIDPRVAARAERRAAPDELAFLGTWDRLVQALAATHGLALAGFGLDAEGEAEGGAFLVFGAGGAAEDGRACLVGWTAAGELAALASTGWSAALGLAGARAREGDAGAERALIDAAGWGRWPAAWDARGAVERLLGRLRVALASGEPAGLREAGRVARALAAAPVRLADGALVPELLGAAFDDAPADERRHLLVALEGLGAAGSAPAARAWEDRLRAVLAASGPAAGDAGLLRQALRAWVALGPHAPPRAEGASPAEPPAPGAEPRASFEPLRIGAPEALLGPLEGWSPAAYRELGALLVASGARPPAGLADPARLEELGLGPALPGPRVALWTWLAGTGDVEGAARVLLDGAARPAPYGDLLAHAERRGDGAVARATLARARELARDEEARRAVDVVALLAGLAGPETRAALAAEAGALDRRDLDLLGALAGLPGRDGEAARDRLLAVLSEVLAQEPPPEQVLPCTDAIERALAALLRARADGEAQRLEDRAAERVRRAPAGETRSRLAAFQWPPMPPALEALDLSLAYRP